MTVVHISRRDNLRPYIVRIAHSCVWAHTVRTCRSPGETGAANLPMNISTHMQNAQSVLAASSSFCMHESRVPGVFGTLQRCLGRNMRVLIQPEVWAIHRGAWIHFQILGLPDRSYLSLIESAGFPAVTGLQALFLTRCPIPNLKKNFLMKMFSEMFQRKVFIWMNQVFLTIKFYWRIPVHPYLLVSRFPFCTVKSHWFCYCQGLLSLRMAVEQGLCCSILLFDVT